MPGLDPGMALGKIFSVGGMGGAMSKESDAQLLQEAIASGIDAFDQVLKLNQDASACYEAASKISDLNRMIEANDACNAIAAKANFILKHADEINRALGKPTAAGTDHDIRQTASDKRYNQVYDEYKDKSPSDIQGAFDQVAGQDDTLSKAAALAALKDLLNHLPPHPPKVR